MRPSSAQRGGEHFTWVEEFLGVEGAFEPLLLRQIGLGELVPHQIPLLDANAVLAAQHSAKIDAGLENVRSEGFSFLEITRLGRIEQNHRVEVSVTRVEAVRIIEPVLF
jgi:hypothetical protein